MAQRRPLIAGNWKMHKNQQETIALLEDVPIWFELWRQLNSFPPNYYQPEASTKVKYGSKNK